jgi:hypothetical protein
MTGGLDDFRIAVIVNSGLIEVLDAYFREVGGSAFPFRRALATKLGVSLPKGNKQDECIRMEALAIAQRRG